MTTTDTDNDTDGDDDAGPRRGNAVLRWIRRFVRRAASIETFFALFALLAIAGLWSFPWAIVVAALAVTGGALVLLRIDEPDGPWTGRFLAARLVLASGALVHFASMADVVPTLGALLTGVAVIAGSLLRRSVVRLESPVAAHLDGVSGFRSLARAGKAVHVTISVAIVGLVAASAFALPWLGAVAGIVSVGVVGLLGFSSVGQNRRRRHARDSALSTLASLEPVFYLHWDAPSEGHYQVTMWVPYLARLGVPFAVIVRTPRQLKTLTPLLDVPIVLCTTANDIDRTVVPSLRTVFYVNTALRNAHYLRFNELHAVQLNHGDSDKPASATRQFRAFDVNFVAGQAAVDRFAHYGIAMPRELLRVVGRPQVEPIRSAGPIGDVPTVLYAPTWGGYFADSDLSSLPIGMLVIDALLARGCRVVFRPHAFTDRHEHHAEMADRIRERLREDASATGREHVFGAAAETEMTIFDCFNGSDAMISDVSSIVTDYLFSEKPLAMVAVNTPAARFRESYPVAAAAYVIDAESPDVTTVLDQMLGDDPLRPVRASSRAYYLGDFPREGYVDNFLRAARAQLQG
ncbi:CDP-glycerol glycerophosphotransferase family protein [Microbacterium sp.]|uniref:CDP-glycerol glycerophosphotransferase family protein n=1 Tax=Microbacterium sp. TaxID=51671 RepID=UPI003A89FC24